MKIEFKVKGRKDYMGFQWFEAKIDGKTVAYHALDKEHALRMHEQLEGIKQK